MNRLADIPATECYVSGDGTAREIWELSPFSSDWYSHKNILACLRYEIAVTVSSGKVIWPSGPWPSGSHSDVQIFRNGRRELLGAYEYVTKIVLEIYELRLFKYWLGSF